MTSLSEKNKSRKAALYIRVSTQWQVDKDSLQVQERDLIAYADLVLGIRDYEVFKDPGYSAKNTDRPAYQSMMARLRTGEFSHLLVWKIDRISRNLLDFTAMYKELKDLGVTFVSKNEQFDTSSAIGEAMLKIILVFAELERQMTSERVAAVMISRATEGKWNGGRPPYGYDYDKSTKTFTVNLQQAEVVRKIHLLYEQYHSVTYIVRWLNEQNIKTRRGNQWTNPTVHKILTSVFYVGDYRYNAHQEGNGYKKRDESEWIIIENHHEPIIDRDLFEKNNLVLKNNRKTNADGKKTYMRKNIHIFGGLLKCGNCGGNMFATLDRRRSDGYRPSNYACSTRRHDTSVCQNKYITDLTLGPFVFNYIANIIHAQKTTSISTSLESLEKKLLRGIEFHGVKNIDRDGLNELWDVFTSNDENIPYSPISLFQSAKNPVLSELDLLKERKRKCESALDRLKTLYLYDESGSNDVEYIAEREKLLRELEGINKQINKVKKSDSESYLSEDMAAKATYFIMADNILKGENIDFERFVRFVDASVLKSFLQSIIDRIIIQDGRVNEIRFKSGMTHKFTYK